MLNAGDALRKGERLKTRSCEDKIGQHVPEVRYSVVAVEASTIIKGAMAYLLKVGGFHLTLIFPFFAITEGTVANDFDGRRHIHGCKIGTIVKSTNANRGDIV